MGFKSLFRFSFSFYLFGLYFMKTIFEIRASRLEKKKTVSVITRFHKWTSALPTMALIPLILGVTFCLGGCPEEPEPEDKPPAQNNSTDGADDGSTDGTGNGNTDGSNDGNNEGQSDGTAFDAGALDGTGTDPDGGNDAIDAPTDAGTMTVSIDSGFMDSGTPPSETTLLNNGNFEANETLEGWLLYPNNANAVIMSTGDLYFDSSDTFTARSGNQSGKLWGQYNGGYNETFLFQEMPAAATNYQLSGWVYVASQESFNIDNSATLTLKYFADGYANEQQESRPINTQINDQWTWVSLCGTVPENLSLMQAGIVYQQTGDGSHGTLFLDDFQLETVSGCETSDAGTMPATDAGTTIVEYDAGSPAAPTPDAGTTDTHASGHDAGSMFTDAGQVNVPSHAQDAGASGTSDAGADPSSGNHAHSTDAGTSTPTHPYLSELFLGNDNSATQSFAEVSGLANTDVSPYALAFLDGDGALLEMSVDANEALIPDENSGLGAVAWHHLPVADAGTGDTPVQAFALIYDLEGPNETLVEFLSIDSIVSAADGIADCLDDVDSNIANADQTFTSGHSLQLVRMVPSGWRPSEAPIWLERDTPNAQQLNPNLLSTSIQVKVYDAPTNVGDTLFIRGNFAIDGSQDAPSWEEASSVELGWSDDCSCWAGAFLWWTHQALDYKLFISRPNNDDWWEAGNNRQLNYSNTDAVALIISDWQY